MTTTKTKFVQYITINDPATGLPTKLEVRQLETGRMIALDSEFLEKECVNGVVDPYSEEPEAELEIDDDNPAVSPLDNKPYIAAAITFTDAMVLMKAAWQAVRADPSVENGRASGNAYMRVWNIYTDILAQLQEAGILPDIKKEASND